MAIKIEYEYTQYKAKSDFNEPIVREYYALLKGNKKQFKKILKKEIVGEFNKNQGLIRQVAAYLTIAYFIIGIGIPVIAMSNSNMIDHLEKSDSFYTAFGIIVLFGFLTLPLGFSYIRSRLSLSEYIESVEKYYDVHASYVDGSSSYENYVKLLRGKN